MPWYRAKVRIECNITQRCNARCDHCNKAVGYADGLFGDMTVDQMKKAVDQLIEQKIWVKRFTFCGGEPVLHSGLQDMIYEVSRLLDYGLVIGRVLTNDLPVAEKLREKIELPYRFKWVRNPLDNPDDPLSGKNDPTKRNNKRYHQPFWISPADIGLDSKFEDCTVKGWCGVGLDAQGWSMCGKATMLGRLLEVPGVATWDCDIADWVNTGISDICKHCQYGLKGKEPKSRIYRRYVDGELPAITETFEKAFSKHKSGELVQLDE